ncbi:signal recognition particle protein [bacterium]|nr:signal recognition particle protein [bacterium]
MLNGLKDKVNGILDKLKGKHLTKDYVENVLREVRLALLEADVHYKVAGKFIESVKTNIIGSKILESLTPYQQIIDLVYKEFVLLMGEEAILLEPPKDTLHIWEIVGLQGSGKTTQSAKLAKFYKDKGYKVLLASLDVYRPAAIEQLRILANNNELDFFEDKEKKPVKLAKKARQYSEKNSYDLLILDTAGRLHIDKEMMKEVENVKAAVKANEIILVVDSMVGQDAANIAKEFNEKLNITGSILTKFDSDTRGGAALSVKYISQAPILFIGIGEKIKDIEVFYPDRMAQRILNMGDVLTLIDKAKEHYDEDKAKEQLDKLLKAQFDFNDYLDQLKQLQKMGSLESLIDMIPGFSQYKKQLGNQIPNEKDIRHIEAMILSMTKDERSHPELVNYSRRKRIAKGSGNSINEVNKFMKNFERTKKMMKKGKMKNMFKNMNLPF